MPTHKYTKRPQKRPIKPNRMWCCLCTRWQRVRPTMPTATGPKTQNSAGTNSRNHNSDSGSKDNCSCNIEKKHSMHHRRNQNAASKGLLKPPRLFMYCRYCRFVARFTSLRSLALWSFPLVLSKALNPIIFTSIWSSGMSVLRRNSFISSSSSDDLPPEDEDSERARCRSPPPAARSFDRVRDRPLFFSFPPRLRLRFSFLALSSFRRLSFARLPSSSDSLDESARALRPIWPTPGWPRRRRLTAGRPPSPDHPALFRSL